MLYWYCKSNRAEDLLEYSGRLLVPKPKLTDERLVAGLVHLVKKYAIKGGHLCPRYSRANYSPLT